MRTRLRLLAIPILTLLAFVVPTTPAHARGYSVEPFRVNNVTVGPRITHSGTQVRVRTNFHCPAGTPIDLFATIDFIRVRDGSGQVSTRNLVVHFAPQTCVGINTRQYATTTLVAPSGSRFLTSDIEVNVFIHELIDNNTFGFGVWLFTIA
jgi:hypothetical protein